jgi:hypothetical protein
MSGLSHQIRATTVNPWARAAGITGAVLVVVLLMGMEYVMLAGAGAVIAAWVVALRREVRQVHGPF